MNKLQAPKREAKNHPVSAFDVETIGPDRKFVCGCYQNKDGQHFTRDLQELRSWLLDRVNAGGIVYATNLLYDFTAVFAGFPAPCKALFTGARLVRVHWKVPGQRVIRFYDTSNLTNRSSVARLGKMVGLDKLDTPPVLIDPQFAGLKPSQIPSDLMTEIEVYNRRDTEITYKWSLRFQAVCKQLGCEVKTTIAATALDLWKRRYMAKNLSMPPRWMNEWFREAYHGGLVFVFRRGFGKAVTYYDIKSLYPYVLANWEYPDTGSIIHYPDNPTLENIREYEGFSRVTVDYPDCYFPILPIVVKNCLLTCTGWYSGIWTHVELRAAEERGATIVTVDDQCIFTKTITPLKAYMEDLYRHRMKASDADDAFQSVYKLFMNALSGKFGQRYDGSLYEPIDVDSIRDPAKLEGIMTIQVGNIEYYIRNKGRTYEPDFINVAWAAYMTAYARLHEIKFLEEAFPNVYACDTDSVFTTFPYQVGTQLGDMDIKEPPRDWMFMFPKQYASWSETGEWMGKVKGVPKGGQADYIMEGSYTWSKPATFKEAAREGVVPGDWIVRTRTDKAKYDKRVYTETVDPRTGLSDSRPFTYREALEYFDYKAPENDWRVTGVLDATDYTGGVDRAFGEYQKSEMIAVLRESCTIPADIVFLLWDHQRDRPRRVRSRNGQLVMWHEGRVDDLATEHGFNDDQAFLEAVRVQASTWTRIRELEAGA